MIEAARMRNEDTHCNDSHHTQLLFWYVVFGALHELAHIIATIVTFSIKNNEFLFTTTSTFLQNDGLRMFLYRLMIGRYTIIPVLVTDDNNNDTTLYGNVSSMDVIRHSGWIFSTMLSVSLFLFKKNRVANSTNAQIACAVTALEAVATDLLRWNIFHNGTVSGASNDDLSETYCLLFCGNFGIIVLHHIWFEKRGRAALDVLEKMVYITMMRGAQSGGVVTFKPKSSCSENPMNLKGIRSRCVNSKRTDLSKLVRNKVREDVFSTWDGSNPFPDGFATVMSGHTRFATSSKATMEGTHPHQWTPPSARRVFNFSIPRTGKHEHICTVTTVENYITHNGDFDFYTVNGKTYDVEAVQKWLVAVTGSPMPAAVDSCAIAGVVDLIRSQGCFGLSARYAVCFGLSTSKIEDDVEGSFPPYSHFENVGLIFEQVLVEMLKASTLESICDNPTTRESFAQRVASKLQARKVDLLDPLRKYVSTSEECGAGLMAFCLATIHAFFDNDLFFTTKAFLKNAKGSFGLCITSSLDAHRQVCLASRGQTISVAFYPNKGLICYGSEQAAVKAGLKYEFPGSNADVLGRSLGDVDNDALRLDLDDLGGEILVLDWGRRKYKTPPVSTPNRNLVEYELMNGRVHGVLFQESKTTKQDPQLYHRMTRLSRNPLIKPLRSEPNDLILADIQEIPKICEAIQDDWHSTKAAVSLNRLTAYNLSRCLRERLEKHVTGSIHDRSIDIVLTGCEVSLWLAEQFASDLQKAFPRLRIKSISSNKILGLFGQEIHVPALGFPYSADAYKLHDSIVIIVSHSGGTFAPLCCANLLQSTTKNIFVVTSEWDTQIGKQLRKMDIIGVDGEENLFNSRIFSTEVGIRPAEPCSISVVATHQLLTNLFEYISVVILSDYRFRNVTGAVITEQDLQILEKCNRMNILALSEIVGANSRGWVLDNMETNSAEKELRDAGSLWADHILENAKAYLMTATYIFVTVVSGYPLLLALAYGAGLETSSRWMYIVRFFDAAIYFWLPQINVTLLRLIEGRNILHRMVGRTVVIGDIPWVSQAAEAFLSKIFACSYSIAGVNVLSGNPADHLVHRYTHRVVRGTLLVCGRPDGRLSALSTAEGTVCLAVNQASSIQSLGGTCESITIGHNPFKLNLSNRGIFLKRKRPLFLCERLLLEVDKKTEEEKDEQHNILGPGHGNREQRFIFHRLSSFWNTRGRRTSALDLSGSLHDASIKPRVNKKRSAPALLGAYMSLEETHQEPDDEVYSEVTVDEVVSDAITSRKWSDKARKLFHALDLDGDGLISESEFVYGATKVKVDLSETDAITLFHRHDTDGRGHIDYDQFLLLLHTSGLDKDVKVPPFNVDPRGLIQIYANTEKYFGETIRKYNAGKANKNLDFKLARSQHFSQELYETRIASLQRFVAMTVMFHQMGTRVQKWIEKVSFGFFRYRVDRTHSIMRIATTASPVSGSDVRQRMLYLQLLKKIQHSVHIISHAFLTYKARKDANRLKTLESQLSNATSTSKEAGNTPTKEVKEAFTDENGEVTISFVQNENENIGSFSAPFCTNDN